MFDIAVNVVVVDGGAWKTINIGKTGVVVNHEVRMCRR